MSFILNNKIRIKEIIFILTELIIENIKKVCQYNTDLNKFFQKNGADGFLYQPDCVETTLKLLAMISHDDGVDGCIDNTVLLEQFLSGIHELIPSFFFFIRHARPPFIIIIHPIDRRSIVMNISFDLWSKDSYVIMVACS